MKITISGTRSHGDHVRDARAHARGDHARAHVRDRSDHARVHVRVHDRSDHVRARARVHVHDRARNDDGSRPRIGR